MDLFNKGRKWHLEWEVYSLKVIIVEFQLYSTLLGKVFQNFVLLTLRGLMSYIYIWSTHS